MNIPDDRQDLIISMLDVSSFLSCNFGSFEEKYLQKMPSSIIIIIIIIITTTIVIIIIITIIIIIIIIIISWRTPRTIEK